MTKEKREVNVAENVLELERLIKKLLRNSFKDSTLDYTVQISVSSLEPGKVKYGFMINGLKKEIQPIALSFYSYNDCKKIIEGLMKNVNYEELEKQFHQGRINVYNNAIVSHQERMDYIAEHGLEEPMEMEEV